MLRHRIPAALLAIALAVLAFPAGADALSYKKATNIALRTLKPERSQDPVILYGVPHPVSSRSRVFEVAKGGSKQNLKRIGRRSYLFWLDQAPGAFFEHPSTLLLVNASSGRIVRREHYQWWPLVDGKRVAFIASAKGYYGNRYRLWVSNLPSQPDRRLARVTAAQSGGSLSGTCMVLVDDQRDPIVKGSVGAYRGLGKTLGVPFREVASGLDLDNALTGFQSAGCQNVLLSIVAHGRSPADSPYPSVALFGNDRRRGGIVRPQETDLDGPYLANILADHPALKYSVTVTSCFGDRWRAYLDADKRLTGKVRVVATSSGPNESTYADPFGGGPSFFDRGFVPALEKQYAPNGSGGVTGPPIDKAIVDAFPEGYGTAAGRLLWQSTPAISDHTDPSIAIAFGVFGDFATDVQDEDRPWGTGKVVATSTDSPASKTISNGTIANQTGEFGPYFPGANVTLTPTPDRGMHFAGWAGQCEGAGATCVLQNLFGSGKLSAAAHFAVTSFVLTIQIDDPPKGIVVARSGPLECGYSQNVKYNYCQERVHAQRSDEDLFSVTATADTHDAVAHHFVSFEGCLHVQQDSGQDQYARCYVAMDSDRTVKVNFADGP